MKVKIKLNRYISMSQVNSMENKILLFAGSHHMFLIAEVETTVEEETYGRKNKTRQVEYLHCNIYGYNHNGDFLGTHNEETVKRYLEYDLYQLRRNYTDLQKQWQVLGALEKKLNATEEQI